MITKPFLLFFFILSCSLVFAQKPIIDSFAVATWPSLGSEPIISDDGNYFMYTIYNRPVGNQTLIIQGTNNEWKKEFIGASPGFFTGDSKHAVLKSNDTLLFFC